jgi:hypothetical protein
MSENLKERGGGIEPEPTERGDAPPTVLYVTGAGNEVPIRQSDPDYKPSDQWLESQRIQREAGGPYSSDVYQDRVLEAVALIRSFEYDRYATPMQLAKKWGYSVRYTRQVCAEARRVVAEEIQDRDYVTATVCEALDRVIRTNIGKPGVGHQKLVVQAAKVWSEVSGIKAPVELRLSRGRDEDLPADLETARQLAGILSNNPGLSLREAHRMLERKNGNQESPVDPGAGGAALDPEE